MDLIFLPALGGKVNDGAAILGRHGGNDSRDESCHLQHRRSGYQGDRHRRRWGSLHQHRCDRRRPTLSLIQLIPMPRGCLHVSAVACDAGHERGVRPWAQMISYGQLRLSQPKVPNLAIANVRPATSRSCNSQCHRLCDYISSAPRHRPSVTPACRFHR
jgi:hypothetical protein